MVQVQGK